MNQEKKKKPYTVTLPDVQLNRTENNYVEDLESHIETTKVDKYVGENGMDLIDFLTHQEPQDFLSFCIWNAMKYTLRYRKRQNPLDLLKAGHYLSMLYERRAS